MIQRYNREQMLFGVLAIIGGIVILLVTWVFIRGICDFMTILSSKSPRTIASLVMSPIIVLGFRYWWVRGERYAILKDADFRASLDPDYQGASRTEQDEQLISGFSDLFAQVFYIGPRLICTGITRIYARLSPDADLEQRMASVLDRMRASTKWLPTETYVDHREEVAALIRLGLVDFSASKGRLKAAGPGAPDAPVAPSREGDPAEKAPPPPPPPAPGTPGHKFPGSIFE
jgi:hypothetical protein